MRIEIAKELRKNAGIVASEKDGKAIRNALSNSLEALVFCKHFFLKNAD